LGSIEEANVWVDSKPGQYEIGGLEGTNHIKSRKGNTPEISGVGSTTICHGIFKNSSVNLQSYREKTPNFWWKNSESKAGLHWKRCEIMKMRKDRGGMEFRDLLTINKALLGKQAWRMVKKSGCAME